MLNGVIIGISWAWLIISATVVIAGALLIGKTLPAKAYTGGRYLVALVERAAVVTVCGRILGWW